MAIKVRPLDQDSQPIWDRFVRAMPAGTFFHRAGWAQVVRTAFRHTPHYVFGNCPGNRLCRRWRKDVLPGMIAGPGPDFA